MSCLVLYAVKHSTNRGFKVKILLADDHGLFRDSMAVWLNQYTQQVQVEFAFDWDSLVDVLDTSFDLIMLDLDMPGMDGAASIDTLKNTRPEIPILVVSANQETQTINACLNAGASGYITKAGSGEEILEAVATVLRGETYRPPASRQNEKAQITETLSNKQIKILAHLAKGDSNKKIAEKMFLSEGTVKQYVSQLLRILCVDNRTQAGNRARQILGIGG